MTSSSLSEAGRRGARVRGHQLAGTSSETLGTLRGRLVPALPGHRTGSSDAEIGAASASGPVTRARTGAGSLGQVPRSAATTRRT
jgi:hypothetical protein